MKPIINGFGGRVPSRRNSSPPEGSQRPHAKDAASNLGRFNSEVTAATPLHRPLETVGTNGPVRSALTIDRSVRNEPIEVDEHVVLGREGDRAILDSRLLRRV